MKKVLLGLVLASSGVGLGCSGDTTISRSDPEYADFTPGYNERDGVAYQCKYVDATVVAEVDFSEAKAAPASDLVPGLHALTRLGLVAEAKRGAIAQMRASAPTLQQIGSCDLSCLELPEGSRSAYGDDDSYAEASPGSNGGAGGNSSGGAQQASTTNNQVAGVDEADFIKNDNQYFYVLSGNQLKIIDAWPAEDAHVIATVPFTNGTPKKLFLGNDRLVVYSSIGGATQGDGYYGGNAGECTYGYECVPTGDATATRVTILDIGTRSAPQVVREFELSGSLIAARKIGDAIHTVIYDAPLADRLNALANPPAFASRCYDTRDDLDQVAADYRAQLDAQAKAIEAISGEGPQMKDGAAVIEPEFRASNLPGSSFLSVLSFGLGGGPAKAESVLSKPGFVYASEDALYVSVPHEQSEGNGWYGGWGNVAKASEIYKFAIGASADATRFLASGIVPGTVLNQFAMDQYGGNLRIATTSGRVPDPDVHSTVTVLGQQGESLVQLGVVDDIAPTEDIRSVRFEGDRGFLVTFKKTDPLYAVDLANPAAPSIAGELKIPGFSTYLHFMDRTHLLAIGLEADDQGSYAYFNGVQLQIFDVNDLERPTLLHKEVIGTRGTTSEALTNHLGFNYFAPKNLLALPMTICEGGGQGQFGDQMTFNGLLVYDVTVAGGFTKKGGISHQTAASCSSWWTDSSSTVKRSVILDDYVYSVADDVVNVANVASLGTLTKSIPLH